MKKLLMILTTILLLMTCAAAQAAGQYAITGGVEGVDYQYDNPGVSGYGTLKILTGTPMELTMASGSTSVSDVITIASSEAANVTVKNVAFSGSGSFIEAKGSTLNLTFSGTNTINATGKAAIHVPYGSTLNILGSGTTTITHGSYGSNNPHATIGGNGGSDVKELHGNIHIGGSIFLTITRYSDGAAIGTGSDGVNQPNSITRRGTITVDNSGTLNITHQSGAGIGGGLGYQGSTVNIKKGTVRIASSFGEYYGLGGASIGAGKTTSSNGAYDVTGAATISGGTVTASSIRCPVTVSGGTVKVTQVLNAQVTGGSLTVNGRADGGSSADEDAETILAITGGTLTANAYVNKITVSGGTANLNAGVNSLTVSGGTTFLFASSAPNVTLKPSANRAIKAEYSASSSSYTTEGVYESQTSYLDTIRNLVGSNPYWRFTTQASSTHSHVACGMSDCTHGHTETISYSPFATSGLFSGTTKTEYRCLTKDTTVNENIRIASGKTLYLCLNGYTLNSGITTSNDVFNVIGGGRLVLCDCVGGGVILGRKTPDSNAVFVGGSAEMYGGKITNFSGYNGGGVEINGSGIFELYDGEITANIATGYGGGVCADNGATFKMYGGTISGNSAVNSSSDKGMGGGVYVKGSFTMSGGEISGNEGRVGGGVYFKDGTLTMGGNATVTNNTANNKNSNVYLPTGKTITCGSSLTTGSIGVTTQTMPTASSPVTYMTDATDGDLDNTFSDVGYSRRYDSEDDVLELYIPIYTVKVTGGTTSHDEAPAGTIVTVTADAPPADHTFKEWKVVSGSVTLSSITQTPARFTMGTSNVKIEAVFQSNHNHVVCEGSTACTGDAHTGHSVQNWKAWDGKTHFESSGYYYLTSDVINNDDITVSTNADVHLCLNGHTISSNIFYDTIKVSGSLTLCDCKGGGAITHQTSSSSCYGYGVNVFPGASFTLYDGSITGNKHYGTNNDGGGVKMNGGTFSMYGGDITGNTSLKGGGGVLVTGGSSMYLHGGTIQNNSSEGYGGGIYSEKSYLEIHGGAITGNIAMGDSHGGGVYIDQGISTNATDFVMTGGTISGNSAKFGGGIYLYDANSDIQNATITGNKAGYTSGGMEILGSGGGVLLNNGSATIKNSTIKQNRAKNGGGISTSGSLTLDGVTISQNTATEQGGGVYSSAALSVSGATTVDSNTVNGNANNVYLPTGKTITRTGALSGTIGVTTQNAPAIGAPIPYMTGATADDLSHTSSDAGHQKRYTSGTLEMYVPGYAVTVINGTAVSGVENGGAQAKTIVTVKANAAPSGKLFDRWQITGLGTLTSSSYLLEELSFLMPANDVTLEATYIDESAAHIHHVCGDDSCSHTGHSDVRYQPWDGVSSLTLATWDSSVYNYYLTGDTTKELDVPAGITLNLCLHGKRFDATLQAKGGTINLCDCTGSGSLHSLRVEKTDDAIGTANLYNIKITDSNVKGVTVSSGVLNMYGGEISGHVVNDDGTGLILLDWSSSTQQVLLDGVTIKNNQSATTGSSIPKYCSAIRQNSGTLIVRNSTITDNKADVRGAIGLYGGTATITDTVIQNNTTTWTGDTNPLCGGGIYMGPSAISSAVLTMEDVKISGNSSVKDGAGLWLNSTTATANLKNVEITGNTAATTGAGVYVKNGTLNVSGSTTVTGNTANGKTVNVYLPTGKTITRTGALSGAIGVTTQNAPAIGAPIPYMTGATADDLSHTSSDAGHQKRYASGTLEMYVPGYTVTVINGTAVSGVENGGAQANTIVTVKANAAPSGKLFDRWQVTGLGTLNSIDLQQEELTFHMPAANVTLEATYIDESAAHIHHVCGDDSCSHTGHSDVRYQAWDGSSELNLSVPGKTEYFYFLTNSVTAQVQVPSGVTLNLCLNGKTLSSSSTTLSVSSGTLNLCDCQKTGKLTSTGNNRALYLTETATANLYDVTIADCTNGGAVSGSGNAVFKMYGGAIKNNRCHADGGAIYMTGPTVTVELHGVTVTGNDNSYDDGHGTIRVDEGTLTLDNCVVSQNRSTSCGAVYLNRTAASISDTSIINNTSEHKSGTQLYGDGGGIFYYLGSLELSGKVIVTGNTHNGVAKDIHGEKMTSDTVVPLITLAEGTLSAGSQIGVYVDDPVGNGQVAPFLQRSSGDVVEADLAAFFSNQDYPRSIDPDGKGIMGQYFTVTVQPSDQSLGTASGGGVYADGTQITLAAEPAENCEFVNWTDASSTVVSEAASFSYTVEKDVALTAQFRTKAYEITAAATPTEGGTVEGAGTYKHGDTVNLTATPNTGYTFTGWFEVGADGSVPEDAAAVSTDSTYSFTAEAARTLEARFSKNEYAVTITVNPTEGGSATGAGTYQHGDNVTLIATPAEGYTFTGWFEDGSETAVSNDTNYSFTAEAARTLEARFSKNEYAVAINVNPTEGGSATGAGTYKHGDNVTLTATPAEGYTFTGWFENDQPVSTDTTYSFTAEAARTLEARFSKNEYAVTITVNPTEGGSATGAGTYQHGDNVTLTATPAEGYAFTGWFENDQPVSTEATYSFTAQAARTLEARFSKNEYAVTITVNPTEGGSATGAGTYQHGDNVTLTATPAEGYAFTGWFEDGSETAVSTDTTYSFTAEAARTLEARFSKNEYAVTITVNPTEGGSATGAGTYQHGDNVTLTATPAEGYTFIGWFENGQPVSTEATYTFTAEAARTFTAKFSAPDLIITGQPQSITVPVGSQAVFTVQATGAGELTYCWQVDRGEGFTNVGCSDAQLVIASALPVQSGWKYRCLVSDALTTVASDAAVLTVTQSATIPGGGDVPPQTGDTAPLALWMCLMAASAAALMLMRRSRKS